jgi:hypothetical protein
MIFMIARHISKLLSAVCLLAMAGFLSGCASTDPDNDSSRSWNTPQSWENGLPGGMMQGR